MTPRATSFREVGDDIGGIIRGHLLEGVGELVGMKVLGEIVAEVIGELLQEIRDPGDVETAMSGGQRSCGENPEQRRDDRPGGCFDTSSRAASSPASMSSATLAAASRSPSGAKSTAGVSTCPSSAAVALVFDVVV